MSKEERNSAVHVAYEDYVAHDEATPEKNLLRAILLTAMSDLRKSGEASRTATEFFTCSDESYIFSFQSICNHLDIDANQILIVTGLRHRARRNLVLETIK